MSHSILCYTPRHCRDRFWAGGARHATSTFTIYVLLFSTTTTTTTTAAAAAAAATTTTTTTTTTAHTNKHKQLCLCNTILPTRNADRPGRTSLSCAYGLVSYQWLKTNLRSFGSNFLRGCLYVAGFHALNIRS